MYPYWTDPCYSGRHLHPMFCFLAEASVALCTSMYFLFCVYFSFWISYITFLAIVSQCVSLKVQVGNTHLLMKLTWSLLRFHDLQTHQICPSDKTVQAICMWSHQGILFHNHWSLKMVYQIWKRLLFHNLSWRQFNRYLTKSVYSVYMTFYNEFINIEIDLFIKFIRLKISCANRFYWSNVMVVIMLGGSVRICHMLEMLGGSVRICHMLEMT